MSGPSRMTVFLTGGAGVLGDTLIDQLAERYDLICLTRRSAIRHPGVETLRGDICQPRLGLSAADYLALLPRIDWVIHSAAITRLDGHAEAVFSVNYQGTEQVLQLVRDAQVPLYHISTAFTHPCDYHPGVMPSTPYEIVKRQAETLVREAGVPVSIFRPSIIIGDSQTGHMPILQGFHLTMGLMMSGYLPIIPCPEGGRVDVIARDVAAAAIVSALDQRLIGDDYFLSNGPQALDIRTLLDLMCAEMAQQGKPFQRPRCMNPDIYERLVRPVFLPALEENIRAALGRATQLCRYASLLQPLPSSLAELLPARRLAQRSPREELALTLARLSPKLSAMQRMLKVPAPAQRRADVALEA
ncbi:MULTISPECIES: SDR family oxidoreductase [Pseudomonas]|uniref:SDR family oxidoreductase n=1 Tax=Pseudomonas TaxID=286 RepID=UPI001F02C010|nr:MULTISPECIES: SDR family oxidoreductase [Pseudomonas]MCG8296407.1 SDR family oxidoreductase [Pseudomonas entomophila]